MQQETLRSTVIPGLRYRDAHAAIEWLCSVLGFERRLVVPHGEGEIAHAQLTLGGGMIMLGSMRDDEHGRHVVASEPGGKLTQAAYIVVSDSDIEALYEHVKAKGARIVMELEEQPYGGSLFAVRDPEGQLWSIGSYDPWVEE